MTNWTVGLRSRSCALAILLATCATTYAQTGPTGTWRVEAGSQSGWEVFLRADAQKLTGLVNYCATALPQRADIYDGNIAGNTITLKCTSPDRDRTMTFTGRIKGDEITFTWERRVRDGGRDNAAVDKRFGASAPLQFTAKRVPDGELARAADEVRGMEFSGAVNLLSKDARAEGKLFVPQKVSRVRAVLVVINYGLGFELSVAEQWRKLSETVDSALLGVWFSNIGPSAEQGDLFAIPGDGLVEVFPGLLQRLAQDSGHPELTDAPLLFWGHSGAGSVAASLANRFPARTLAFVRYHSGPELRGDLSVLNKIPALFLAGGKDPNGGDASVPNSSLGAAETLWKSGRASGAPWTFGIEPNATHGDPKDLMKANDLMIPWIEAVLRQRLSPDGTALRTITDGSAWLGNNRTGQFAPYATFPGPKTEASWLPDEASARAWQTVTGPGK
jgi:hypothetical protein